MPYRNHDRHYRQHFGNSVHHLRTLFRHHPKIGTTVEWYDFFIYATAAGLVFAQLFFEPAGASIALLLSFASVGVSFLFRPLCAVLAGHYGDKLGRRAMLVLTLILMGAATTLIGFPPTYATAGALAPIMLLLLRIPQGISAGGEWGGAVLMAVEHGPPATAADGPGPSPSWASRWGCFLATGVTALMTGVISPGAAFLEWGWRVPFLMSIVLIVVGYFVRRAVDESPVFQEIAAAKKQPRMPTVELFRRHGLLVVIDALIFAGNNAAGYMATGGFIPSLVSSPAVGHECTDVLVAVTYGAGVWFVFTYLAGYLSDRIGRKNTYFLCFGSQLLACFPLFWLINTGSLPMLYLAMTIFSVGLGLAYGPQAAALYSEMFPASVRFSGVSVSYVLGAILGGALPPQSPPRSYRPPEERKPCPYTSWA